MAEKYLIDTCAVIKHLNSAFPAAGIAFMDALGESIISFVSEIELQAWNPPDPVDLEVYSTFISQSVVLRNVDDALINKTIEIRKSHKLKIPDALICATAMVQGFTLISDNDSDFKKVSGLKYLNPRSII